MPLAAGDLLVADEHAVALDLDVVALAQLPEHILAEVVDEGDAGLDQRLRAEVRVPAGDRRLRVEDGGHADGDQRVRGHPVEVDVVDDRDVAGRSRPTRRLVRRSSRTVPRSSPVRLTGSGAKLVDASCTILARPGDHVPGTTCLAAGGCISYLPHIVRVLSSYLAGQLRFSRSATAINSSACAIPRSESGSPASIRASSRDRSVSATTRTPLVVTAPLVSLATTRC